MSGLEVVDVDVNAAEVVVKAVNSIVEASLKSVYGSFDVK